MSPLDKRDGPLVTAAMQGLGLGAGSVKVNQRHGASTQNAGGSLERNPSVLSRKDLIKQEYNLLIETRLPKIMQLMNSEKSLGLGLGYGA
jgi:hypothetical protein